MRDSRSPISRPSAPFVQQFLEVGQRGCPNGKSSSKTLLSASMIGRVAQDLQSLMWGTAAFFSIVASGIQGSLAATLGPPNSFPRRSPGILFFVFLGVPFLFSTHHLVPLFMSFFFKWGGPLLFSTNHANVFFFAAGLVPA